MVSILSQKKRTDKCESEKCVISERTFSNDSLTMVFIFMDLLASQELSILAVMTEIEAKRFTKDWQSICIN